MGLSKLKVIIPGLGIREARARVRAREKSPKATVNCENAGEKSEAKSIKITSHGARMSDENPKMVWGGPRGNRSLLSDLLRFADSMTPSLARPQGRDAASVVMQPSSWPERP